MAHYPDRVMQRRADALRVQWLSWVVVTMLAVSGCASVSTAPAPVAPGAPQEVAAPQRWIRVHKSERMLYLYEGDAVIRAYRVVLGKDPVWAKLYQGDHRTPEGEYHISRKYYHPFWSRFMLLDYPTSYNHEIYAWSRVKGLLPVRRGRVPDIGGAVGIHGTEDERLNRRGVDWTEGCVSLFNHDIDELYDLVPIGTRVVIER